MIIYFCVECPSAVIRNCFGDYAVKSAFPGNERHKIYVFIRMHVPQILSRIRNITILCTHPALEL